MKKIKCRKEYIQKIYFMYVYRVSCKYRLWFRGLIDQVKLSRKAQPLPFFIIRNSYRDKN